MSNNPYQKQSAAGANDKAVTEPLLGPKSSVNPYSNSNKNEKLADSDSSSDEFGLKLPHDTTFQGM